VRLHIRVTGRPAPQGSKDIGAAGQLLESSAYLPAWRAAVKIGAYKAYAAAGIVTGELPVFTRERPVVIEQLTFLLETVQCRADGSELPIGKPDIDKLLRSTLDALGGARRERTARLFEDDSQVVRIERLSKQRPRLGDRPGAIIIISDEGA
jgi:Holliday junction resolvase RusA-like endonuclease